MVRAIGWMSTVLHGDPCVLDRWRWLRRRLSPGDMRTLDAGCGSGAFSLYAARIGNVSVGISFNERQVRTARRRATLLHLPTAQFIHADLRELDALALPIFDQIICTETIEHIRNDKKLLHDIGALLRPGGKLLLTTPFKFYKPLFGDRVSEQEDGGHVRVGYTHQELRALLDECGLDIESEEYVSGLVSQQLTNVMRILGKLDWKMGWAVTFPLRALQVLDRPLTFLLRYPCLSVAVVGVKRPTGGTGRGVPGRQ